MTLVAITGGIGAGKSTVLKIFSDMGYATVDADDVAHKLYSDEKSGAFQEMLKRWGTGILSAQGNIDRKQVARRVFENSAELDWLNRLLHPAIQKWIADEASRIAPSPLFCAIPLLYESGWEKFADCVIGVWCSADSQLVRLRGRGWSDEEIKARLNAQFSMDEKLKRCDFGIINDTALDDAKAQCIRIIENMKSIFGF